MLDDAPMPAEPGQRYLPTPRDMLMLELPVGVSVSPDGGRAMASPVC